jgi:hypothetical protein
MGYCQVSDVQADFKTYVFNSTSVISSTTVTGFINEASALIDSYVGGRYQTPITGTQSLLLMSLYCRALVVSRIQGITEIKQQTNITANQTGGGQSAGLTVAQVLKNLSDIRDNNTLLSDATLKVAGAGFYSNNYEQGVNPRFRKNRRQW